MIETIAHPSPNFDDRPRPADLIVLHYTGMSSAEAALRRLTDPAPKAGAYPGPWQPADPDPEAPLGRVSAHYVVDEAGAIYALVPEEARAWHAGVSAWEGESGVNDRSIGIEIVNGGHDFGLPPFTEPQVMAVIGLVRDILRRRGLGPHRVVGHSDIAPGRKLDPGERFPWSKLAAFGAAIWPDEAAAAAIGAGPLAHPHVRAMQEGLAAFGYAAPVTGLFDMETRAVIAAFQRRFRPDKVDGLPDSETAALLADVSAQVARLRLKPS